MRLATIRSGERETAAVVTAGGALPVERLNAATGSDFETDLLALISAGRLDDLRAALEDLDEGPRGDFEDLLAPVRRVRYGPPYRRPRKIWGIGLNYAGHAADLDEKAPRDEPASFMRPDTTIIGPGDEIVLPRQSERVTAEAELALVIGRKCKSVPVAEAPSVVAGFAPVLDMTAEDLLRRNPRYLTRAKSFDTFFSFGPHLLTPDEVGEAGDLEVATVLNGEVVRKNAVSNMTFSPYELVAFHSEVMTLLPGDIISTGTPGAVVVEDGDVAGCRITGFELLCNPVKRR
jgi:2-keto-4-pentenoate hydratase/2-oxohepta-3-ene-1,7-dioic acid hydratase in catechol pathway